MHVDDVSLNTILIIAVNIVSLLLYGLREAKARATFETAVREQLSALSREFSTHSEMDRRDFDRVDQSIKSFSDRVGETFKQSHHSVQELRKTLNDALLRGMSLSNGNRNRNDD